MFPVSKKIPWGFIAVGPHGHLTAKTTVEDRKQRAELGETAIKLLGGLGIGPAVIEKLNELPAETEPAVLVTELEVLLSVAKAAQADQRAEEKAEMEALCAANDTSYDPPVA